MTLTEMRQWLEERGIRLTKSLGQNFLFDQNVIEKIAAESGAGPGSRILEIGPGLGPLTEALLARGASVLAIEKDQRLVGFLRERHPSRAELTLVLEDAVRFLRSNQEGWTGWGVVSNLPYSVGSVILVDLALHRFPPDRITVTLQREVVDRLRAAPGSRDYGVLSVLVQATFQPHSHFRISADCFFPKPDVESACISLIRRANPFDSPDHQAAFVAVVKGAFSQRRKQLGKVLKSLWSRERIEDALGRCGLDPAIRPEQLSVLDFVRLAQAILNTAS